MATTPNRAGDLGTLTRKAVASCLTAALLTAACAGSEPRLAPPADLSAADREACEGLAERARAQVLGGSVWGGTAAGIGAGTLLGVHGLARGNVSEDGGPGLVVGAFFGALAVVLTGIGAGLGMARDAGVREAAYGDAMDACLRPAILALELGPEHLGVAQSLHALAYRYHRLAEFVKAEPLYVRALAIQERSLGADAPEVATILDDYAALLRQTGRVSEAGELEQRARAIRGKR
jgi:hypothetical protein